MDGLLGGLVELVEDLLRRPRAGPPWRAGRRRPETELPLLLLSWSNDDAARLIDFLGKRLAQANPRHGRSRSATHVRVQGTTTKGLRSLLGSLVHGLANESNEFGTCRFPRYWLVETLIEIALEQPAQAEQLDEAARKQFGERLGRELAQAERLDEAARKQLDKRIREQLAKVAPLDRAGIEEVIKDKRQSASRLARGPELSVQLLNYLVVPIRPVALLLLRLLVSVQLRTRWAWLGGRYHWFRTRPYKREKVSTDFFNQALDLVGRATDPARQSYLDELLVYAFLEDLRACHRRGLNQWARTAYCVVLLDQVTADNGGIALYRYINKIRLVTGQWNDGLLLIGAGRGGAALLGGNFVAADRVELREQYEQWRSELPRLDIHSHRDPPHRTHPWLFHLTLQLPARAELATHHDITYRRRPLLSRPAILLAVAVLVFALLPAGVRTWRGLEHCHLSLLWNADQVVKRDGECVGLAASGYLFKPAEGQVPATITKGGEPISLDNLQRSITEQNELVERSGRPYVTIVHLGRLTTTNDAGIHELAGVHLAQLVHNQPDENGPLTDQDPLVKIRLANAGDRLQYQLEAARQIAAAAREDQTIVGVVGMGRNTPDVEAALGTLGAAGLPVVTTTNSSDHLARASTHYFHIAPTNDQAAQIAADFLADLTATRPIRAGVVIQDTDDPYSRELTRDFTAHARQLLPHLRLETMSYTGTPSGNGQYHRSDLADLAEEACNRVDGRLELIYYTGRTEDLSKVFNGVDRSKCKSVGADIVMLSGDDLTRYGGRLSELVSLYHATLTYPPIWGCVLPDSRVPAMFAEYTRVPGIDGSSGHDHPNLVQGHTALAYDATTAITLAATEAFRSVHGAAAMLPAGGEARYAPVTASAVLHQLERTAFAGATGWVDLIAQVRDRAADDDRTAWRKAVALVQLQRDRTRVVRWLNGPLLHRGAGEQVQMRETPACSFKVARP